MCADINRTVFVYQDNGSATAAVGDVDLAGNSAGEVDIDFDIEQDASIENGTFTFDMDSKHSTRYSGADKVSGYGIVIENAPGQNKDVSASFTIQPNPNHTERPQIQDTDAANSGQYVFSVTVYDGAGNPAGSDPRIYNR